MEHNSSFNKQLRKEITARAVMKKQIKNIPKDNPFNFTDIVKKQKEDDEIDLGLFLELAEENKTIYNQMPLNTNTLIEDMEKLKNGFFYERLF